MCEQLRVNQDVVSQSTYRNRTVQLLNKLTFAVVVTECSCSHVTQSYGTLATAVDKRVALVGMKLCCCDHFSEFFHVGWF